METAKNQNELLQDMNEEIIMAMLKFCQTQKGRLTEDRKQEFSSFVSAEVSESAQAFLYTALGILTSTKIKNYARKMSGEFYENFHNEGKQKLAKTLQAHISSANAC